MLRSPLVLAARAVTSNCVLASELRALLVMWFCPVALCVLVPVRALALLAPAVTSRSRAVLVSVPFAAVM